MRDKPRLFDDLDLVALPTAVSCARMFAESTLTKWGASPFVVADALVVAQELVTLAVQDTGVADDTIRWSELDHLNRIVVRLLGFARHVVIEVWDAALEPAALPDEGLGKLPAGLHLVDVTANQWGSVASPQGRLTWAEIAVYDRTDRTTDSTAQVPPPAGDICAPAGRGSASQDSRGLA
ncbi:MAG TPA: hypothetical protein VHX38_25770 [Pseudonocardiaceae bacterium]|jgi:hypothetical protein|nr:hypothetical protein [Pseudonocardiaceae bacterium]